MHSIAWWPTLVALAVVTCTDLYNRLIPNWVVFPFWLAGIVVTTWHGGWHGLVQSLLGMLLGLVLFGILALMGGMGMGDVKLCAAIGAWIGPGQLILALVVTGIVGGVMAVGAAVFGGYLPDLLKGAGDVLFKRKRGEPESELTLANPRTHKIPYAPAIAIGTLFSFFAQ
jgi:prepilin peptidase CpaA